MIKSALILFFTTEEITVSIKNRNKDSSPGPDSLTSKCYNVFVQALIVYLEVICTQIYTNKDSGSLLLPRNYRPISLLTTEYKILTSMLAKRLLPFLPTLIHPDQACAIQNRNIHDHLHLIRDFISYTNTTKTNSCILSIDQAKAFDRVLHDWLDRVIERCILGSFYKQWIRILYYYIAVHNPYL